MPQTFSDNNKIYSVDMMFAYIHLFKPKHTLLEVSDFLSTLEYKGWGGIKKSIAYSPRDVLANPKKYKNEIDMIEEADLKYPIIVHNGNIVDGVHRLCKSVLMNKRKIKAYEFDKALMAKFLINNEKDWDAVDNLKLHELIVLFVKRF